MITFPLYEMLANTQAEVEDQTKDETESSKSS